MGFYLMWSAVLKRSGIMIWLAFPLVVLAAFQIVLLYLFGNSIIATDMFTNLLTTNPEEAGELLSNIYLSIIIVCAIYLPLLWFASRDIGQRHCLSKTARKNIALIGLSSFILGGLFLAPAYKVSEDKRVLKTDIFRSMFSIISVFAVRSSAKCTVSNTPRRISHTMHGARPRLPNARFTSM